MFILSWLNCLQNTAGGTLYFVANQTVANQLTDSKRTQLMRTQTCTHTHTHTHTHTNTNAHMHIESYCRTKQSNL